MNSETPGIDFKSATLYAIRVVLQHADTSDLIAALDRRMADAGSFFENEPVVIDAMRVEDPLDWMPLVRALANHRLPVIGVVATGDNLSAAIECGLVPVDLSAAPVRSGSDPTAASATSSGAPGADVPAAAAPQAPPTASAKPGKQPAAATPDAAPTQAPAAPTMLVRGPLRSGQRIYARNGDLIVMGVVSRGAEVIADGNIHVYGPLRGKAMAGARGDSTARIFTTGLDAELVAVAGVYRVVDTPLPDEVRQRPAVIQLDEQALRIGPLEQ